MKNKKVQGIIVLTTTALICSVVLYIVMKVVEA